jgi:hypothetical protein
MSRFRHLQSRREKLAFLDADTDLRKLITEIIRQCPKKREQIAEEMSSLTGQRITVHMLNALTSESNRWSRFPAIWLETFSTVVGTDRLERYVISKRNRDVLEFGEAAITVINEAARKKVMRRYKGRAHTQTGGESQTALPLGEPE